MPLTPRQVLDYRKTPPSGAGWVIPELVPADGWTMLQAAPKTGKSMFAAQLMNAAVPGKTFLAWKPAPVKTLYIQVDAPPGDWHAQLEQLDIRHGITVDRADLGLFFLDHDKRCQDLHEAIAKLGVGLVIWDAAEKLSTVDLNKKDGCLELVNKLQLVWNGPSILIHHPRKLSEKSNWRSVDEVAGHHYLAADASSILTLRKRHDNTGALNVLGRRAESKWVLERDPTTHAWTTATIDKDDYTF